MSNDKHLRVSIGLDSTPPLAVRLSASALDALLGDLKSDGIVVVEAEDATVHLDASKVVFVRVEKEEQKIGFGL